jgi:hypothetical protein
MTNDLTRTDGGDGFDVTEPRTGFIVGSMIKFVDRDFMADKTEKLPEGTELAALSTVTAWVKWEQGKPVQHLVTHAGKAYPRREDLPDLDQEAWEINKFTGDPADCWHDTRYLHLIDPRTGRDFTFVTDTYGGRAAVGDLKNAIANVRRARPGAVPVVKLGWKQMSTQYGPRPRPLFDIIEWRDGGSSEPAPQEPMPQIKGPDNKKAATIEHRKEEFDDSIPF